MPQNPSHMHSQASRTSDGPPTLSNQGLPSTGSSRSQMFNRAPPDLIQPQSHSPSHHNMGQSYEILIENHLAFNRLMQKIHEFGSVGPLNASDGGLRHISSAGVSQRFDLPQTPFPIAEILTVSRVNAMRKWSETRIASAIQASQPYMTGLYTARQGQPSSNGLLAVTGGAFHYTPTNIVTPNQATQSDGNDSFMVPPDIFHLVAALRQSTSNEELKEYYIPPSTPQRYLDQLEYKVLKFQRELEDMRPDSQILHFWVAEHLASTIREAGLFDLSERLLRAVIELREGLEIRWDCDYCNVVEDMAITRLHRDIGDDHVAGGILDHAMNQRKRRYAAFPALYDSLDLRREAIICMGKSRWEEAERLLKDAIVIANSAVGVQHQETIRTKVLLSTVFRIQNKWSDSAKELCAAYEGTSVIQSRDNPTRFRVVAEYLYLAVRMNWHPVWESILVYMRQYDYPYNRGMDHGPILLSCATIIQSFFVELQTSVSGS